MKKEVIEYNLSKRTNEMVNFQAGDVVKVYRKIKEGEKERIQAFEGMVIAVKGKQSSSPMITVRKVSFGVGVEVNLPIYSPRIEKIELIKHAKVRRAKLYNTRTKSIKSMRMKYTDAVKAEAGEVVEAVAEEVKSEVIEKKDEAPVVKVMKEKESQE